MTEEISIVIATPSIVTEIEQQVISVEFPHQQWAPWKSAYDVAVDNGFEWTEEEWLESLQPEVNLLWYTHSQPVASNVRSITHSLWYKPNFICQDTWGNILVWTPNRIDLNVLTISFSASVSGYAYLS
jgi:hypothetical protein